jgi:hypothetical protein
MPQRPPNRPSGPARTRSASQSPTGQRPLTKKQRRRQARPGSVTTRQPWWQSPYALGGGSAVVVALIAIFAVITFGSSGAGYAVSTPTAAPASVIKAVTEPSASLLSTVGEGGQTGELIRVGGTKTLKNSAGLPEVVYVGAEYCPFCAAERWSLIMALSRFGSFTNLKEMSSDSTDVYPDTSTFTFIDSSYSSGYLDFSSTETEDRSGNTLQTPSSQVQQLYSTYDQSPYVNATDGAEPIPFLDIAGRYILFQSGYSPQVLQGLTWQQIASDLGKASSPVTQAIVGNANWLTAAICLADGNQPASVCGSSTIQTIASSLGAQATIGSY